MAPFTPDKPWLLRIFDQVRHWSTLIISDYLDQCHAEGHGGYQLIGRTLPIWNSFGRVSPFTPDKSWLLCIFDQVRHWSTLIISDYQDNVMQIYGGCQLIGRTLPIWNSFGRVAPFTPDKPLAAAHL